MPLEYHLQPWFYYESTRQIRAYRAVEGRLPDELSEMILAELR